MNTSHVPDALDSQTVRTTSRLPLPLLVRQPSSDIWIDSSLSIPIHTMDTTSSSSRNDRKELDQTSSTQALSTSPSSSSSTSSDSTTSSSSSTQTDPSKKSSWDGLLMEEIPLTMFDPTWQHRQRRARQRIKEIIFNSLDIDWMSIPAVEDTPFKTTTLLECADLRCKGSTEHFDDVVKDHWKPPEGDKLTTVDGVPMFDMIG